MINFQEIILKLFDQSIIIYINQQKLAMKQQKSICMGDNKKQKQKISSKLRQLKKNKIFLRTTSEQTKKLQPSTMPLLKNAEFKSDFNTTLLNFVSEIKKTVKIQKEQREDISERNISIIKISDKKNKDKGITTQSTKKFEKINNKINSPLKHYHKLLSLSTNIFTFIKKGRSISKSRQDKLKLSMMKEKIKMKTQQAIQAVNQERFLPLGNQTKLEHQNSKQKLVARLKKLNGVEKAQQYQRQKQLGETQKELPSIFKLKFQKGSNSRERKLRNFGIFFNLDEKFD